MTLAVRGVVELFRMVSHDYRTVRIYGHYPVLDRAKTTFYRYIIHTFDFTSLNSKEKWMIYKFTKNIYDI
jgi:hypothetical protein